MLDRLRIAVPDAQVQALRAFNRFYTRRIGVLQDGLLGTAHPLPEARVLYELGQAATCEVTDLRRALGLDAGYLSRLLTALEAAGLVARAPSPRDGRRQLAGLTAAGRVAHAELDRRSADSNRALLEDLPRAARDTVLAAMDTVRAALDPPADTGLRAPGAGELGWIVARHGALYAAEYGWDARFEALVAEVVAAYAAAHDPAREGVWIAEAGGQPAGCVMCVADDARTARLRLLLVEPHARGLGLGGRLVDECLGFARAAGYARMVLWTNDVLAGARRLYDQRGFALVDEAPHSRFGPPVRGQTLALDLSR